MTTRVQTLIVGAGQAGLAASRWLTDLGQEHLVLERGSVAERWRSERWDSFRLLTPNWQTRLPGHAYDGPDPDGFMPGSEIISFFDDYARSFGPDVRTGVTVTSVAPVEDGWRVHAGDEVYVADNVVVATGHYDRPAVPAIANGDLGEVQQLHSATYRNPDQLAPGAVLVVGSGPSGQQIADELALAGQEVHLAVGRHRPLPRTYRGADVYAWLDRMGMLKRTIDTLPPGSDPATAPSVVLSGDRHDLNLHRLAANGVSMVGRLTGISGGRLRFAADLAQRVAEADAHTARLRQVIDGYVEDRGLRVPAEEPASFGSPAWAGSARRALDVRDVSTIVWATGYWRDYSWLHAPVLTERGEPDHHRGVTAAAGLYFVGLRWQYRRNSNFIDGVGADAGYVAMQIARRNRRWCEGAA